MPYVSNSVRFVTMKMFQLPVMINATKNFKANSEIQNFTMNNSL